MKKYIALLITIIFFSSCKSKEISLMSNLTAKSDQLQVIDCPEKGICIVEVFKNKDITHQKDGIGQLYSSLIDGTKTVIKYTYKLPNPNNYADGNRSETLQFVIDNETKSSLKDSDLQNIKLLFGKNTFSRDIQGNYRVTSGTFSIKNTNGKSEIKIDFIIPKLGKKQFVKKVHLLID